MTKRQNKMAAYYKELVATTFVLDKERAVCHKECYAMRWRAVGNFREYNPHMHTQDCYSVTKELLRLIDVYEFVINPASYNPGAIMRQVETGKYNLRKRKYRDARECCVACSMI